VAVVVVRLSLVIRLQQVAQVAAATVVSDSVLLLQTEQPIVAVAVVVQTTPQVLVAMVEVG
jgi:hypothetical protein